ncbi:MAG: ribonuclease T [Paracoccaceae bacterium]
MRVLIAVLIFCLGVQSARADKAGEFDYYVMALGWSPNWCALEGRAKGSSQCDMDLGWNLHGLWPQYHRGYPEYCQTAERPPSRSMTADMVDIMGSSGLAWHQWKKHGTCTGLSARAYFDLSREAYGWIVRPAVFRKLDQTVRLPAAVVEEAFLKANPQLEADGLTVTCRDGHIQEVRVCYSRALKPVPCGQDVVRDCRMKDAIFEPIE